MNTRKPSHLRQLPRHKPPASPALLPTIFYTNCTSSNAWKLAELEAYIEIDKPNIICLTETWLDVHKQQIIKIDGFDSHFSNRKSELEAECVFSSSTDLNATLLTTHTTKTLSAAWTLVQVKTHRPIIIGCIYHPPNADHNTTLDSLEDTVAKLTPKYPTANLVITGDFNRLPVDNICEQFGLSDLVDFSTRDDSKLDLILSDVAEYNAAVKLPPISNNDHCCILVEGQQCRKSNYVQVQRRVVTPQRKNALLADLASASWNDVLDAKDVHEKVTVFHNQVTVLLDKHCPEKTVKVRSDKPPWITNSILKLMKAREEAYHRGCSSHKFLRCLIQKAIRSSKRRYINEKLNSEQNSEGWWDTIKHITNAKTTTLIPE